jgi:hypothetical protein
MSGRQGVSGCLAVGFVSLTLLAGACDAPPDRSQPTTETQTSRTAAQGKKSPDPKKQPAAQTKKSSDPEKQPAAKGRSFTFSAGRVTVRRVGFDSLRFVRVSANPGWRNQIDDDFDDSIGVEFFKRGRNLDFNAALDNGRLTAEACQNISRLSARPVIGEAAMVALQRIGDEDLHVSIVKTSPGWQARITDNNSEDVEVLFLSNGGEILFEAQLNDGLLEGSICKRLA